MKKSIPLFSLRLFFYLSIILLIRFHPGITISYDRIGFLQWFIIVPYGALIAFLPLSKYSFRYKCFFALIPMLLLSFWAGGISVLALQPLIAGLISFAMTFLLFYHPRWAKVSVFEPFFLAWVCLRLLAFSRSGEEAAGQSLILTQFIFVWTAVVFLFHNVVIYLCVYPNSRSGVKRETAVFFLASAAALFAVLVVLPAGFIKNTVIENMRTSRLDEIIRPSGDGIPRFSRGRDARRTLPGSEGQRPPELRGVPEDSWGGYGGRNGGDNRQYTVMVVASRYEPVYMGSSFRGQLDPVEGFRPSPSETLNNLSAQRFFVTWFDNELNFDTGRKRQEIFSLSTLPQNFLPYRPVEIDPVILSENSGPLRYIHRVYSNANTEDPLDLARVRGRDLSAFENNMLSHYLEIPLHGDDLEFFMDYLDNALKKWRDNREEIIGGNQYLWNIFSKAPDFREPGNEYIEIILALLTNFSGYQYNLTDTGASSVAEMKNFLVNTMEGDCVEFSNSLALLGRLAGIPSRIVTGYLAAEGLQTIAHLRGLAALRSSIPVLQQFPFNDLYLVTNAHGHAWAQFYIPDYGWLDFEATLFAIPPPESGDIGNWDVVIPLINENRVFSQVRIFPWRAVLRSLAFLAAIGLLIAYALRYGREVFLYLSAGHRACARSTARSLYLLLLARLAADGKPIKPASKTAMEFADLFPYSNAENSGPHFRNFAALYSELRWREFRDDADKNDKLQILRQEYSNILLTTRRKGIFAFIIRIFSLRGLAYL
jgi:hypothetical protein